jgi:RNA polymerase sigma-70 factor, ECF subfamily
VHITQQSDETLMLLVRDGDSEALGVLYDRYSKPLLAFFFRMLSRDKDRAEDFLQDLFMKIIEKPDQFDPSRRFRPWLYHLAYNLCKNEYRSMAHRESYKTSVVPDDSIYQVYPMADYDANVFESHLNALLELMDEKFRSVFLLRYQQEMKIEEIATITGIPEGTVKTRLFNTAKQLAVALQQFNPQKC